MTTSPEHAITYSLRACSGNEGAAPRLWQRGPGLGARPPELPALPAACGGSAVRPGAGPWLAGSGDPGAGVTPCCAVCGRPCALLARRGLRPAGPGVGPGGSQQPPFPLASGSPATGGGQPSPLGGLEQSRRSSPSPVPPADGPRRAGRTVPPPPAPTVSSLSPPRRILCADLQQAQKSPLLPAHCRRLGCCPGTSARGLGCGAGRAALLRWLAQADLGVTPGPVPRLGVAVTSTGGVGRRGPGRDQPAALGGAPGRSQVAGCLPPSLGSGGPPGDPPVSRDPSADKTG